MVTSQPHIHVHGTCLTCIYLVLYFSWSVDQFWASFCGFLATYLSLILIYINKIFFCKSLLILAPSPSFLMVLGFTYVYSTMSIFFSTVLLSVWRHHIAVADRDGSCLQGYHGYLLAVVHLKKTYVVSVSAFTVCSSFYMWSWLDHYWYNVCQQDHHSSCMLKHFIFPAVCLKCSGPLPIYMAYLLW